MGSKRINRVELDCYDAPIHCVFCGQMVVAVPDSNDDNPDSGESFLHPCEHTLFIATDEGFDYQAQRFSEAMREQKLDEQMSEDDSYDSLTDKIELPNAIKLAIYVPAPGFHGAYIGFALPKTSEGSK